MSGSESSEKQQWLGVFYRPSLSYLWLVNVGCSFVGYASRHQLAKNMLIGTMFKAIGGKKFDSGTCGVLS